MADDALKKPLKGILKHKHASDSFSESNTTKDDAKSAKWDEMNIMATLHPSDKDYGMMKIDEPKTPYNWSDSEKEMGDTETGDTETDGVNANDLAKRLTEGCEVPPKALNSDSSSEDERDGETPEARAERERFEKKRKLHYGGMPAAKLLRQALLDAEDDEDEDDEDVEGRLLEEGEASPPTEEQDDEAETPTEAAEEEAPVSEEKQIVAE